MSSEEKRSRLGLSKVGTQELGLLEQMVQEGRGGFF